MNDAETNIRNGEQDTVFNDSVEDVLNDASTKNTNGKNTDANGTDDTITTGNDTYDDDTGSNAMGESAPVEDMALNDITGQKMKDLENTRDILEQKLIAQQNLASEHLDGWRRLQAEFDNYRKREEKLRGQLEADVKIKLMKDFLSVVDSFERATEATKIESAQTENTQIEKIIEGVKLVFSQMESMLAKWDLKRIEALGKPFDPNLHEAISKMPHHVIQEDHISTVVQNGWQIGDKIIRPATVIISEGNDLAEQENNEVLTSAKKEA